MEQSENQTVPTEIKIEDAAAVLSALDRAKAEAKKFREEKEKLFQDKVEELKGLFEKTNLNNLKQLKFDIKTAKIQLEDDEEEVRTTTGVVNEGDEQG